MTRAELKKLMEVHDIGRDTLADLLMVSTHTVRSWLLPERSASHRNIRPSMAKHIRTALER